MEETPMQQLIDKIELYRQRGGINMETLQPVLQAYLRLETEYLKELKGDVSLNLSVDEARKLLRCLVRTSAKGEDLDVGEKVEDMIRDQLLNK
jgi:hypothetical protein